jgi:hypothetical protein
MSKRNTSKSAAKSPKTRPFFNLATSEIARRVDLDPSDSAHMTPTSALAELARRRKPKARALRSRIALAVGVADVEINPSGVAYVRKTAAEVAADAKTAPKRAKANAPVATGSKRPKLFRISDVTGRPVFASAAKVAAGEQTATPESLAAIAVWEAAQKPLPDGDATATKGARKAARKAAKAAARAADAPAESEADTLRRLITAHPDVFREALASMAPDTAPADEGATAGVWLDGSDDVVDADEAEAMDPGYRTLFGIRFARR